jgi:hypothetical protein
MSSSRVRTSGRFAIALGVAFATLGTSNAVAAGAPVDLGSADSYAVVAGTTVTNTGPSVISGDLGLSPGTAVVGFPPGTVDNGAIHAADAVALQAQADVNAAFNDAAGRATTVTVSADLAGQTLVSGVYTSGALALNGALTLDAQGDPNAVFVFQAASKRGAPSMVSACAALPDMTARVQSRVTLTTGCDPIGSRGANAEAVSDGVTPTPRCTCQNRDRGVRRAGIG